MPGGSRIREDGGDDRGVVGVCGHVDEDAAAIGCGFDRVLLSGEQVADPLFGPWVAVAGIARERRGGQLSASVLVARERADNRGVSQGLDVGVEAGGEGAGGVDEETDD